MTVATLNKKIGFFIALALCFIPFVDGPIALLLGFATVNLIGNPFAEKNGKAINWLLRGAIIGLGFGMNFYSAAAAGRDGFLFTVATIVVVLIAGYFLGKLLKVDSVTAYLVSAGTAICGGSAIAAVAPVVNAQAKQISVSLAVVFLLNAVALLLFPLIGHYFELSQHQFGLWCAIAIHDTSSVVGAASAYGNEALETATTVKLARALWIIPLSLITLVFNRNNNAKLKFPYFILFFILSMLISTYFPEFDSAYDIIVLIAKKALVIALFLVGCGLKIEVIKSVGGRTLLLGLALWLLISVLSLSVIGFM